MKVENNRMVSLSYILRESNQDGRIIETVDENRPLNFIYGTGRLLPLFESNLFSLNTGDKFSFPLSSADAYGDRVEEMIINVPKSVFMAEDGKLNEEICRVGNEVPMMDNEGHHLNGVINEIAEEYVRMDFNHPMAGVDLFFSGKIVDVREATDQELAGVQGCSGCSGNHGSDCSGCS